MARGDLPPRKSILEDELNDLIKETEKEDEDKSQKREKTEEIVDKRVKTDESLSVS